MRSPPTAPSPGWSRCGWRTWIWRTRWRRARGLCMSGTCASSSCPRSSTTACGRSPSARSTTSSRPWPPPRATAWPSRPEPSSASRSDWPSATTRWPRTRCGTRPDCGSRGRTRRRCSHTGGGDSGRRPWLAAWPRRARAAPGRPAGADHRGHARDIGPHRRGARDPQVRRRRHDLAGDSPDLRDDRLASRETDSPPAPSQDHEVDAHSAVPTEPPRVQWRVSSPGSGCCRGLI